MQKPSTQNSQEQAAQSPRGGHPGKRLTSPLFPPSTVSRWTPSPKRFSAILRQWHFWVVAWLFPLPLTHSSEAQPLSLQGTSSSGHWDSCMLSKAEPFPLCVLASNLSPCQDRVTEGSSHVTGAAHGQKPRLSTGPHRTAVDNLLSTRGH